MKKYGLIIIAISLIWLGGCEEANHNNGELNCTDELVPAITVEVKDEQSGSYIGCGAIVTIEDTGFSETVTQEMTDNCSHLTQFYGAYEREGIYNVHVSQEGYLDWSVYNVEVNADACHVLTVNIVAELVR